MPTSRYNRETEEHLRFRYLVILSLFIIGNLYFIYLLARGAYSGHIAWRLQFTGQVTIGNVVRQKEVKGPKPPLIRYYPIIEYKVGGQAYSISSHNSSGNQEDYPTGSQVNIRYDPSNPSIARIDTWEEIWFGPEFIFIFVPIASALGNLALLQAWFRYKERLSRYKEWQGLDLKNDS
jgi:hypothetical protein